MKEYQSADIRNFAIVGHGGSGKTMLSEAMLVCSDVINRLGSVANGNTVSDYHEDEQARQISIHASLLHTVWAGKKFNIIDTPGYSDFISESLGALRVGDFALVVVDAVQGVEAGTDQVWNYATNFEIPKILLINGLDREYANFDNVLDQVKERFGNNLFPMNTPINAGLGFNQILDVIAGNVCDYQTDGSGLREKRPAAGEWRDRVEQMHQELIEYVAESDDTLLEKFFEKGLTEEEMRAGIHTAVRNQSFVPLFCASAETNIGVSGLMDFIAEYAPSPQDRAQVKAVDADGNEVDVALTDTDPVMYVFKTLSEAHLGEMSFFRIYSGIITSGMDVYNSARKINERIGQVYLLNGKERESVKNLNSGDIGAVVKLKDTHTNETLCGAKKVVTLLPVEYPKPNIHASLKPKSKGEEEKIAMGLGTLHEEDPTFIYHVDSELRQTIISGQGELHLQVITDRLKSRFKVEIELHKPKIPFRETICANGGSKYRHKKQTGGAGQFAEVWMRIEPKERGEGVEFMQSLVGQNVDRIFVPSVEKGVMAACEEGIIAGYRAVDLKVDFYDGKQHPVDSKDVAFQIAGKQALKEAFKEAKPCLLEPIYNIEVTIPEDSMGDVMGDISSRRGKIQGMDSKGRTQVVKAQVPQAELHYYATTLRSLTGGRGIHSEEFSHYEEMPRDYEQKVIAESQLPVDE